MSCLSWAGTDTSAVPDAVRHLGRPVRSLMRYAILAGRFGVAYIDIHVYVDQYVTSRPPTPPHTPHVYFFLL